MVDKFTDVYNYFFPCKELHDRREKDSSRKGKERRADTCYMNSTELKRALNKKFDALATTITHAKDLAEK